MAVLEMLPEVIGAVELLRLVALAELVHVVQVLGAQVPVGGVVGELVAAVAAYVGGSGVHGRGVEGGVDAGECGAGPGVATEMERVLVALSLVFVFEAIGAVLACVLLFGLMSAA